MAVPLDITVITNNLFTQNFDCVDNTGAPASFAGKTVVMNVWRVNDLVLTSLPNPYSGTPDINLVLQPGGVTGRVAVTIGSDIVDSLLQPLDLPNIGLRYRIDLLDATLGQANMLAFYGAFGILQGV